MATEEASDSGEWSLCLTYDPALTVEQLEGILGEAARINAEIVSDGAAGIATVHYQLRFG